MAPDGKCPAVIHVLIPDYLLFEPPQGNIYEHSPASSTGECSLTNDILTEI